MPEGQQPRGATPHPRSGAAAESARLRRRRNRREEPPHVQGQGRWLGGATPLRSQGQQPRGATPPPRSSGCGGAGGPRGDTPRPR